MFIRAVPNLLTLLNLYCGFLSIAFAATGDYKNASILILIGMMLDSVDGRLARILKVPGELGKQLDSLADIVTFGVAPSILIYYVSFNSYGFTGLMIAGLFPLFGAYRLARFNIDKSGSSSKYFTGVPITAAGGVLTLLVMMNRWVPDIVLTVSFITLCFLMVSRIKIPSFKKIPVTKFGAIMVTLIICSSCFFMITRYQTFSYFILVAIPVYLAFISFRWSKMKRNPSMRKKKRTF